MKEYFLKLKMNYPNYYDMGHQIHLLLNDEEFLELLDQIDEEVETDLVAKLIEF
jgi:hypothetical protein